MKQFNLLFIAWLNLQAVLWFKIGSVEAIFGGTAAVHGQFKYMVSVQESGKHICGGAIIGEEHVLTAAHCVIGNDNKFINKKFKVLAGVVNLMLDNAPTIEVAVRMIFVPTEYRQQERKPDVLFYSEIGDLAVLKLKEKLPLGEHLVALTLPARNKNHNFPKYTYALTTLVGFGAHAESESSAKRTHSGEARNQGPHMRHIQTIVQQKSSYRSVLPFETSNYHIVARVDRSDLTSHVGACHGDDGSPLVYENTLIGILAQYYNDCNEKSSGSVYTRISSYIFFINGVTRDNFRQKDSRCAAYKIVKTSFGEEIGDLEEVGSSYNTNIQLQVS